MLGGWFVFAVTVAVWWPHASYWQSDDFIAVHYAQELRTVLQDFIGNQYGAPGLVFFYRPLFASSFWIERQLGGTPFVSHLGNALALGLAAVLLMGLVERLLGPRLRPGVGLAAALAFLAMPGHAGSVFWAAGRVDSHTAVFVLLSVLAFVHWLDGAGRGRVLSVFAFGLGLLGKEIAVLVPAVLLVLGYALAPERRAAFALRACWPHLVVLALYLGLRFALFGRVVGGYGPGSLDPVTSLAGFARFTLQWLDPLRIAGADGWRALPVLGGFVPPPAALWLGLLPAAIGVVVLVRAGRARVAVTLALLYVLAALPLLPLWHTAGDPKNLRYLTIPGCALAALIGAGGRLNALVFALLCAPGLLEARADYADAHARVRRAHELLQHEAQELPPGLVFIAGLPRENEKGTALMFHLGVDRLLQTPWGDGRHRTLALRPLSARADAERLDLGETRGLPEGVTLSAGEGMLGRLPPAAGRLEVELEGPPVLDPQALYDLHHGRSTGAFVIRGPRATHYRLTLFTAGGYLSTVLPDEAPATAPAGRVHLHAWLAQGRFAASGDDSFVAFGLAVPCTLDLETRFPLLVESGSITPTPAGPRFAPTASSARLVPVTFAREYAEFLSGRIPDRKALR